MNEVRDGEVWYPSVEDVLALHEDIITEDPDATRGIHDEDRIEYAISHVRHGHYGEGPEMIHEKAFHLMRLLAANHWFADGNKRTALNTTALFYAINGYEFDYGEDVRSMLKLLSVREELVDADVAIEYFAEITDRPSQTDPGSFEELRTALIALILASTDVDLDSLSDYELFRIISSLDGESGDSGPEDTEST